MRALDAGHPSAPHEVLATVGNTEAMHLALTAACQPGDVVAVESPISITACCRVESLGLKTLEIP